MIKVSFKVIALSLTLLASSFAASDYNAQLIKGAREGDLEIVKDAIKNGADKDFQSQVEDHFGATALHWASRLGHANIVDFLIKNGANIHAISHLNSAPLQWAISNDARMTAELLLKAGVDANTRMIYKTNSNRNLNDKFLLKCATHFDRPQCVSLLLEYGAFINDDEDLNYICKLLNLNGNATRCLISLTLQDKYRIINSLFSKGLNADDIDKIDALGNTALVWSSARGEENIVKCILDFVTRKRTDEKKPIINNKYVVKALTYAQKHNHKDIERMLQRYLQHPRNLYLQLLQKSVIHNSNGSFIKLPLAIYGYLADFIYGKRNPKDN